LALATQSKREVESYCFGRRRRRLCGRLSGFTAKYISRRTTPQRTTKAMETAMSSAICHGWSPFNPCTKIRKAEGPREGQQEKRGG
jgi:hypothetical protein